MNIFYPNAGRQGVARQTEWRQKLPESGIFGGNAGNIYIWVWETSREEYVHCCVHWEYVRLAGGARLGSAPLNVMKTTAAKNHLARAAPRCRSHGKWSTVWYAVWQSQQNISLNGTEPNRTQNTNRRAGEGAWFNFPMAEFWPGRQNLRVVGAAPLSAVWKHWTPQMFTSKYGTSSGEALLTLGFVVGWQ